MAAEAIPLGDLLQCLVECSQKAAKIAQIFREEKSLFELLVEEKTQIEINKSFVQDFKTLADVLVQETIKKDVGEQFPSLIHNIFGEEQNSFQNSLGESIRVELTGSAEETIALLNKVLDGREKVAQSLAEAVHSFNSTSEHQYSSASLIPTNSIGIWIDPIDSTAEYIQAKNDETEKYGIKSYGLRCVCVLIGVYALETGKPILGVVNQPFFSKDENDKWESRLYWAVNHESECATSPSLKSHPDPEEKVTFVSCFENRQLQDIIATKYKIVHAAGAGYKSLLVACKKADLYILPHATTSLWDTCGPHALLAATGGGILNYTETIRDADIAGIDDLQRRQVKYLSGKGYAGVESFRNKGGIIVYRNPNDVIELLNLLRDNGYLPNK